MAENAFFGAVKTGASGAANLFKTGMSIFSAIDTFLNYGKPDIVQFDTNKFRESFRKEPKKQMASVARTNMFNAMILPPSRIITEDNNFAKTFIMRVEEINLPSRRMSTAERRTYGPVRKVAYASSYEEIDMNIILSDNMIERQRILDWLDFINPSFQQEKSVYSFSHSGDVNYYDDYVGQIQINVYDSDGGEARRKIYIHEAYPIQIGDVQMSWSEKDTYMKIPVKFAYYAFFEESFEKKEVEDTSILGRLRRFRDDVRNLITDIKNFKFEFKKSKQNLREIEDAIKSGNKASDPLDRLGNIAGAGALLGGGISDVASKMMDRGGSVMGSVTNFSKSFF